MARPLPDHPGRKALGCEAFAPKPSSMNAVQSLTPSQLATPVPRRAQRLLAGRAESFYSLIHDRRVGEYVLPAGSVVIGAGNRAHDAAIVKPMSSALINRMLHVHLKVSAADWLAWAHETVIHLRVVEYASQGLLGSN